MLYRSTPPGALAGRAGIGLMVIVLAMIIVPGHATAPAQSVAFKRGDVNGDGDVNLDDPVRLFEYLFVGWSFVTCLDAADADDDGRVNVTDSIYMFVWLFSAGDPPVEPFPFCGHDPSTGESLGCESYSLCEG